MRMLLVMDPFIAVPPRHYGGIERVIADLADGLTKRGHDVALWAAPGSGTTAVSRRSATRANGRGGATCATRSRSARDSFETAAGSTSSTTSAGWRT